MASVYRQQLYVVIHLIRRVAFIDVRQDTPTKIYALVEVLRNSEHLDLAVCQTVRLKCHQTG